MALATKGLIAAELICPETVYFFGPRPEQQKYSTYPKRQKVRGKLRLVMSKPIKFNQIEIRFKGVSQLNWRNPLKSQHLFLAEKMHAWKTLRKWRTTLVENAMLPAGVTEFGFEVILPGHLCSTFKSPYLEILYTLSAVILPSAKFAKETTVTKEIKICKTLVPKDVVYGCVTGFRVPRLLMRGERPGSLLWEFLVPRWVCLESGKGIEFDGILHPKEAAAITIEKIDVDIIQEELYRSNSKDTRCVKRHLVMCMNPPSTYIHPPLETPISFDFPLQIAPTPPPPPPPPPPSNRRQLRRVHSVPTHLSYHDHAPITRGKSVSATGELTTLSRGHLTYSLDSPFLRVRHFIRLVIHVLNVEPICIGLPIPITRHIHLKEEYGDVLPTYNDIIREGEQLPDYHAAYTSDTEENIPPPPPPLPPPGDNPALEASIQQTPSHSLAVLPSREAETSGHFGMTSSLLQVPPGRRRHQHSASQPPSMLDFQRHIVNNSVIDSSNICYRRQGESFAERASDVIIEERTLEGFYIQTEPQLSIPSI